MGLLHARASGRGYGNSEEDSGDGDVAAIDHITWTFLTAIDISGSDSSGDRILAPFEECGCLSNSVALPRFPFQGSVGSSIRTGGHDLVSSGPQGQIPSLLWGSLESYHSTCVPL
jgi:hypothetical protein